MADSGEASTSGAAAAPKIEPRIVEYDPITGVPSEFNEFLPPDCPEYKKWKSAQEAVTQEGVEKLAIKEKQPEEVKLPGGKVKKKTKPQVVVSVAQRQKNKSTTTVAGLELFGVKLSEAGKLFGKKFACGASVVKTASGGEQIEMQGDFLHQIPELLLKNYKNITKDDVFYVDLADGKKKKLDDAGGVLGGDGDTQPGGLSASRSFAGARSSHPERDVDAVVDAPAGEQGSWGEGEEDEEVLDDDAGTGSLSPPAARKLLDTELVDAWMRGAGLATDEAQEEEGPRAGDGQDLSQVDALEPLANHHIWMYNRSRWAEGSGAGLLYSASSVLQAQGNEQPTQLLGGAEGWQPRDAASFITASSTAAAQPVWQQGSRLSTLTAEGASPEAVRSLAAVIIQSYFRGWFVRRQVARMRSALRVEEARKKERAAAEALAREQGIVRRQLRAAAKDCLLAVQAQQDYERTRARLAAARGLGPGAAAAPPPPPPSIPPALWDRCKALGQDPIQVLLDGGLMSHQIEEIIAASQLAAQLPRRAASVAAKLGAGGGRSVGSGAGRPPPAQLPVPLLPTTSRGQLMHGPAAGPRHHVRRMSDFVGSGGGPVSMPVLGSSSPSSLTLVGSAAVVVAQHPEARAAPQRARSMGVESSSAAAGAAAAAAAMSMSMALGQPQLGQPQLPQALSPVRVTLPVLSEVGEKAAAAGGRMERLSSSGAMAPGPSSAAIPELPARISGGVAPGSLPSHPSQQGPHAAGHLPYHVQAGVTSAANSPVARLAPRASLSDFSDGSPAVRRRHSYVGSGGGSLPPSVPGSANISTAGVAASAGGAQSAAADAFMTMSHPAGAAAPAPLLGRHNSRGGHRSFTSHSLVVQPQGAGVLLPLLPTLGSWSGLHGNNNSSGGGASGSGASSGAASPSNSPLITGLGTPQVPSTGDVPIPAGRIRRGSNLAPQSFPAALAAASASAQPASSHAQQPPITIRRLTSLTASSGAAAAVGIGLSPAHSTPAPFTAGTAPADAAGAALFKRLSAPLGAMRSLAGGSPTRQGA
ncbi:hypothetical protein GPECTOR_6g615 [Gonium pectorale]|uniref:SUI1 domain-containing protein n=1 Tax=Gonium pectorale TaxID=33097 RepID=A0A150GVI4_GONPE|nr:hypothetical protein GPECTOR_6g615 [Gonium pectorale]|eukprot:KXZ53698.1 hypothetical protein GPECTOR_6g615 [Gonium pectorale]